MITTIKEFRKYLNTNESTSNDISKVFIEELNKLGINATALGMLEFSFKLNNNDKYNGIRISTYNNYLVMEMIDLDDTNQRKGYGEKNIHRFIEYFYYVKV